MFEKYVDKIKLLEDFKKENILKEDFQLYSDSKNRIKIYYAPHNEIINKKAKKIYCWYYTWMDTDKQCL